MRATRSDDTILDGVFVPDRYVVRVVPAGAAGIDPFVLGLFAWALLGFGNIYYGLARRALDVTIETAKSKRSIGLTRPMAYHAELQHRVAQMGLAFESIGPHLDRIAEDWSNGVDHGAAWPAKIFAAKFHAVEESWRIVDLALEVAGGFGIFREERPRTAVPRRAARAHPPGELDADARDRRRRRCSGSARTKRRGGDRPVQTNIVGLISSAISEMRSAGRPARRACSRIASMLGASYSQ